MDCARYAELWMMAKDFHRGRPRRLPYCFCVDRIAKSTDDGTLCFYVNRLGLRCKVEATAVSLRQRKTSDADTWACSPVLAYEVGIYYGVRHSIPRCFQGAGGAGVTIQPVSATTPRRTDTD